MKYIGMNHFPPPPGLDRPHGWHGPHELTFGPLPIDKPQKIRLPTLPEEIRREHTRRAVAARKANAAARKGPWAPVDPWREPPDMDEAREHFGAIIDDLKVKA